MLAIGALFTWPSHRPVTSTTVSVERSYIQDVAQRAAETGVDWRPAAIALSLRDDAAELPGIGDCLAWREFTPEYVRSLLRRRDDIVAWTNAPGHDPIHVVFIGGIHVYSSDASPELVASIIRSQEATLRIVDELAPRVQVVTIEDAGPDIDPVTWDRYLDVGMDQSLRYDGQRYDRAELAAGMIAQDRIYAPITMLRNSGLPPIIYGEEPVLYHLHQWLVQRQNAFASWKRNQAAAAILLTNTVAYFRTEMTLVRALEYLRAHGGTTAVITQGLAHADDYEEFKSDYRVNFDMRVPVKPNAP